MKFTKFLAMALAVAMLFTFATGCNAPAISSDAPAVSDAPATPVEPIKVSGVVESVSLSQMVVNLEDGTTVTLDIPDAATVKGVALGDTIEVEYSPNADGNAVVSANVTKAAETEPAPENAVADETPEAESAPAVDETPAESEATPSTPAAPAVEQTVPETPAPAQTSTANTNIANMTPKQRAEAVFAGMNLVINDWTTPAVMGGNSSMGTDYVSDMSEKGTMRSLGSIEGVAHQMTLKSRLAQYGYNYEKSECNHVMAFNDLRGLDTVYVGPATGTYWLYDEATDTFTKHKASEDGPAPVGGNTTSTAKPSTPAAPSTPETPSETPKTEKPSSTNLPDTFPITPDPSNPVVSSPAVETNDVNDVIDLINAERVKAGLGELKIDERLMEAADIRAEELAEVWAHTRPDGTDWFTILPELGIKHGRAVENAGMRGADKGGAQVQQWMDSAGHKKNILEPKVTHIGVGNYNQYWIMISAEVRN